MAIKKKIDRIRDEMKIQLKELEEQKERVAVLGRMAAKECPVHIGDIVIANFGYAHNGKQMKVDSIAYCTGNGSYGLEREDHWMIYGSVLKKDGTPGLNTARKLLEV